MAGDLVISTINGGAIGTKNVVINGNFGINQRGVSGTVVLAAGVYGHDRFKAGASGCTYTFATSANVTTLTISAGSLVQVVEGLNLQSGTYTLSWTGTAQGKINGGSYAASGLTGTATGGTNLTVEFSTGSLSFVQLEKGSTATAYDFRDYGRELIMCQRYYNRLGGRVANDILYQGYLTSGSATCITLTYPTMRTSATATKVGTWGISQMTAQPTIISAGGVTVTIQAISNLTGQCSFSTSDTSTYIDLSAEL